MDKEKELRWRRSVVKGVGIALFLALVTVGVLSSFYNVNLYCGNVFASTIYSTCELYWPKHLKGGKPRVALLELDSWTAYDRESNALAPWVARLGLTLPRVQLTMSGQDWCIWIPLWLPLVAIGVPTGWFIWHDRRRRGIQLCRHCHYDLTGNISGICPECGTAIPLDQRAAIKQGAQKASEPKKAA